MKTLLLLSVAGFVACCTLGAADTPPPKAAPAQEDSYDLVYFAESRPVLIRLHVTVDGKPLTALWEECITKVFKYLDTNGDGFLDKDEVQRVPSPGTLFGGGLGGEVPTLAALDTNGDGKVSRDELAAYYRRHGAAPFQVPGGRGARDDLQYERFFRLKLLEEELLTLEEFALVGSSGRVMGNADSVNDALFKLLDTNGDGKLSKEELLAAPEVLKKLDRNDDEMITPDEILPGAGRGNDGSGNTFTIVARSRLYNARGNNGFSGPFWLVQPGQSKMELARQLQQRYARTEKATQTKKLSAPDLGLDKAAFAKLDVDGDGLLDAEELSRFADRTPDLELKLDLGKKGSVDLVKRGRPLEANVRAGKGGVLMLEMDGTRLDLKSQFVVEIDDAAAIAKQEREQYLAEFKRADRDNNGYLDMAEAMRSPLYRNLFKLMDRDGDGMLFEKEVIAYLDTYQELQAAARKGCASVSVTSEGKGLFELIDTDGDRRLSVRELRNAWKLIAELDRDGDGMISRTEIPRCTQATFRMGPAAGSDLGYYKQAKVLDFSGRMRGQEQPVKPARGPEWFRKMDRNGDGDVSRREFLGTDAQFKEIDTDGDGLISVEEAEAYDKKLRDQRDKK